MTIREEAAAELQGIVASLGVMLEYDEAWLTAGEHRLIAMARAAAEEAATYLAREPVSAIAAQ